MAASAASSSSSSRTRTPEVIAVRRTLPPVTSGMCAGCLRRCRSGTASGSPVRWTVVTSSPLDTAAADRARAADRR